MCGLIRKTVIENVHLDISVLCRKCLERFEVGWFYSWNFMVEMNVGLTEQLYTVGAEVDDNQSILCAKSAPVNAPQSTESFPVKTRLEPHLLQVHTQHLSALEH
jgi:hypothetical protein